MSRVQSLLLRNIYFEVIAELYVLPARRATAVDQVVAGLPLHLHPLADVVAEYTSEKLSSESELCSKYE